MKPLIGVTVGEVVNVNEEWAGIIYGQRRAYTDCVLAAGGAPLLLPITDDESVLRRLYEQCDGILFSGGNDIDPAQYGAELNELTRSISPRRDEQELQLMKWSLEDDKPVFGICRGMQLLNVALGGTLRQDISAELPAAHNHFASGDEKDFLHLAHVLRLKPDSQLARILGTQTIETNALHHQGVLDLGNALTATAWSEDEVVEGIELPQKRFVVAVQSHPEALADIEPRWQRVFQAFVDAARPEHN